MTRTLAAQLGGDGDVLLAGPAVRALAADGPVDLLASPAGAQAAALLPGVRHVHVFDAPWVGDRPPPLDRGALDRLVAEVGARHYDRGLVFVSQHQSPLPAALVLRAAGVRRLAADCEDEAGSLLDVRHRRAPGRHEVQAALDLAAAVGARLPADDDVRLAVRGPLPDVSDLVPRGRYVVVHPGAAAPARAPTPGHAAAIVEALAADGQQVVVTGSRPERGLAAQVAGGRGTPVAGRTSFARLAAVLRGARAVVVGNTGPAYLAAAVGTPVVSLFSPVVPAETWRPWRVRALVLGDQAAACAGTCARRCPVAGHPCLSGVTPERVVEAVHAVARGSTAG